MMSTYQEETKHQIKSKDIDIPISKILPQSPIKHNVIIKNQPIRKIKVTVVTKEEVSFKKRKNDNWFSKYYNYRSNDNSLLSLPYPAKNYNCGIISNIFDNYDINVKISLLFNLLTGRYES